MMNPAFEVCSPYRVYRVSRVYRGQQIWLHLCQACDDTSATSRNGRATLFRVSGWLEGSP